MQGMSERQYAAHVGLSRGAIQKATLAAGQCARYRSDLSGSGQAVTLEV